MSRALRRHPLAKQARRAGKAPVRPLPRVAPSRPPPRRQGPSGLGAVLSWRPRFLMDIINELRKVVWPSREDTIHLTVVVVVVSIILGAVLGGIDIGFGWLVDHVLLR